MASVLFAACMREAERLGGDERTAEYFFNRARASRVCLSNPDAVTVADVNISTWCAAIAWSAPGLGRRQTPANSHPSEKQPRSGARARA